MSNKVHVSIFTDGACRGNPGPGGWAALLRCEDKEKTISGGEKHSTNNRMELKAAIEGLKLLKFPCRVDLFTDSEYVQKGMTQWRSTWEKNNWKNAQKKPVKNMELWQELFAVVSKHEVHWHWVRGHNGHVENERVDELARRAIDACGNGS